MVDYHHVRRAGFVANYAAEYRVSDEYAELTERLTSWRFDSPSRPLIVTNGQLAEMLKRIVDGEKPVFVATEFINQENDVAN